MDDHAPERGAQPPASPYLRAGVILGVEELTDAQRSVLEGLLVEQPGWYVEETSDEWGPVELAARVIEAGAELVVAAGGDGTVSAVASALASAEAKGAEELPPMAVLPFGTANDLARTLAVAELDGACAALRDPSIRTLDVVRARFADGERTFVNVANGGLAWDIGECLDDEQKSAWGALAYARGALEAIGTPTVHRVTVAVDDRVPEPFEALTVAVSNGRSCGGGLQLAPTADLEDGLLEVIVVRDVSPAGMARLAARMRVGAVVEDDALVRLRGRALRFEAEPPMRFVFDGELVEGQPLAFEVVPKAVRALVGAGYAREPAL
jgi:diacylglycerol kinase (ATP)